VSQVHLDARGTGGYGLTLVAGCASVMPTLAAMWRYVQDALNDTPALSVEITRLSAEVEHSRLDRANLLAAMRAALAAYADGEADPLWYLRDELDTPENPADAARRPR
jgi:hypothetical protein